MNTQQRWRDSEELKRKIEQLLRLNQYPQEKIESTRQERTQRENDGTGEEDESKIDTEVSAY